MHPYTAMAANQLRWEAHPTVHGARIAYLLTPIQGCASTTCAMVELPSGVETEPHVHDNNDDLLYILSGKGAMWVQDQDDAVLEPGCFLCIPKGLWHRPHAITETMLIYNIWSPTLG